MTIPGLITEFSPVIIRRVVGELTDEQMRTQLQGTTLHLREMDRAGSRTVTIVDLSHAARMTATQRKMQSEWLEEHQATLSRVSLGTAFVVRSQLVRGALTAIFWLRPPPHDYVVTTSLDEAIDWALARLRERGIPLPDRLVADRARALLDLQG